MSRWSCPGRVQAMSRSCPGHVQVVSRSCPFSVQVVSRCRVQVSCPGVVSRFRVQVSCPGVISGSCPGRVQVSCPGRVLVSLSRCHVHVVSRSCPGRVQVVSRCHVQVQVVSRSCPGRVQVVSRCHVQVQVVSRSCPGRVQVVSRSCRSCPGRVQVSCPGRVQVVSVPVVSRCPVQVSCPGVKSSSCPGRVQESCPGVVSRSRVRKTSSLALRCPFITWPIAHCRSTGSRTQFNFSCLCSKVGRTLPFPSSRPSVPTVSHLLFLWMTHVYLILAFLEVVPLHQLPPSEISSLRSLVHQLVDLCHGNQREIVRLRDEVSQLRSQLACRPQPILPTQA